MSKGFQVDTKYQGYVFLGSAQGMFETRDGQRVPYRSRLYPSLKKDVIL